MALVSITKAASLVSRGRATLYRDISKGRLSKTVLSSGETAIETSELIRVYGQIGSQEKSNASRGSSIDDFEQKAASWGESNTVSNVSHDPSGDSARTQILEERIRSLERVIALEADLRKVKDEVTSELRARLEDKDQVIKSLEGKMLLLEYTKPTVEEKRGFWAQFRRAKK
jgi:hypothetical protein